MMSLLVSGSRFPVGSSASSTSGRLTKARAMATRCCSPPDSSLGSRFALPDRPDHLEHVGHHPVDHVGRACRSPRARTRRSRTPSSAAAAGSPGTRSRAPGAGSGCGDCGSLFTWNFDTWMSPCVGVSSASSRRMNVDLPEPDGPMRKTNSPFSILSETLSRAGRAEDLYCLLTWSRVIITARQCSGVAVGAGLPRRCQRRRRRSRRRQDRGGVVGVPTGRRTAVGGGRSATRSSAGSGPARPDRRRSSAPAASVLSDSSATWSSVGVGLRRRWRRGRGGRRASSSSGAPARWCAAPRCTRDRARSPAARPGGLGCSGRRRGRLVRVVQPRDRRRTPRSARPSTCGSAR